MNILQIKQHLTSLENYFQEFHITLFEFGPCFTVDRGESVHHSAVILQDDVYENSNAILQRVHIHLLSSDQERHL